MIMDITLDFIIQNFTFTGKYNTITPPSNTMHIKRISIIMLNAIQDLTRQALQHIVQEF